MNVIGHDKTHLGRRANLDDYILLYDVERDFDGEKQYKVDIS